MNSTNHTNSTNDNININTATVSDGIQSGIRIFVLSLTVVAAIATIYCTLWFYRHRKERIVLSHQPEFLITICIGLLIWILSVIPLSIDGTIASQRGCDIACILYPWFQYIGFTLSIAGLYSKFWRINKIFHNAQFRKISVKVMDVMKPFACISFFMFTLLLLWTILDPPKWNPDLFYSNTDNDNNDDGTDTYKHGACTSGSTGSIFSDLLALIAFVVLIATIRQAYKARNVSSDFSETWPLALGLLNWVQLYIVTIPAVFLISYTSPSASYYLIVAPLLANCITMLLALFLPVYLHPSIRHPVPTIGDNIRVTEPDHAPVVTGITLDNTTIHNTEDSNQHDEETSRDVLSLQ